MSLKASSISVSGLGTSLMNRTAPLGECISLFSRSCSFVFCSQPR